MPLNIEVKADIDSLRLLADWFGKCATSVHDVGTVAYSTRADAEGSWGGESGQAFASVMHKAAKGLDAASAGADEAKTVVHAFADDMATVKSRMEQARHVAANGGLTVTETEIQPPGEAPSTPSPLPTDGSVTPEQVEAHTTAQSAVDAHNAQVSAYNEAQQIVNEARGKQNAAMEHLARFGKDQISKTPFTVADVSTGLAAEAMKRTSKFRALAASYGGYAERALRLTEGKTAASSAFRNAARLNAEFVAKQRAALDDAVKSLPAQALDKLPTWAKSSLSSSFGDFIPEGGAVARVGKSVLGKVPVVGTAITAAGIGYDIAQGKDATKAVVSGVSSLAAGAAVGAAIGGPVGVVVGAAVGAGVGYVVDEWGDEIADGAKAVGGAVADGAKAVGNFIGDLF